MILWQGDVHDEITRNQATQPYGLGMQKSKSFENIGQMRLNGVIMAGRN